MVEKKYIDLNEYERLVKKMCNRIDVTKFKFVYGVERGGVAVAISVAQKTGLKQIDAKELVDCNPKNVLVVDDLIDSGNTKDKFKRYEFRVLIDKQKDEEYKGRWIEFWYEKTESDDKDLVLRIAQRLGVEL